MPTLLIYDTMRSPLSVAEEMHARIPGSTLVVIPKVGHMIAKDAADRFNAEVRHFLKSVES